MKSNFFILRTLNSISKRKTNNKRFLLLFLVTICAVVFHSGFIYSQNQTFTIVLDAGHGDNDPGTHGKFSKEKDITLVLVKKVGKLISNNFSDTKVIYTRTTDVFIPLHKRAEIANKNNADLFISIHVDGVKNNSVTGTSTFVMGLHKTDENLEVAKRENSVISIEDDYSVNYEGFDPNSAESYIIFSLLQNKYLEQSLSLASNVQNQFKNKAKRSDRGVKQAGFLVLWKTMMPSVLIETGFLTNPEEEKFLNSESGQDSIANSIYRAFCDYKNEIENKTITKFQNNETQKNEKNTTDSSNTKNIDNENSTSKLNDKTEQNNSQNSEIIFKVQIAASPKKLGTKPKNFKGLQNVEETKVDKMYKYTVGNETDYNEVVKLQQRVKKSFPDAFIVAFKSGKKITINEALKEIKH